jgi:hypothetical protein
MRKKGVKFPLQYDETRVPVLTPPGPGAEGEQATISEGTTTRATTHRAQRNEFGHLSKSELYRVAVNIVEMLEDMIYEGLKNDSNITDNGIILVCYTLSTATVSVV